MSKLTFINVPCPPGNNLRTSMQELTELYQYTSALKAQVEQARRDYYQSLSEYTGSLKAKSRDQAYLHERAEAHISATLAVLFLQEPFYQAIKTLVEFLKGHVEEWEQLSDPKRFRAGFIEGQVKRHNFVCTHELLEESVRAYSMLNQVNPSLAYDLLRTLDEDWEKASADCAFWPKEMPMRAHNAETRAVADLLMSTLSLGTTPPSTFHVSTDSETGATIAEVYRLLKEAGWKVEEQPKPIGGSMSSLKVRKPRKRTVR